MSAQRARSSVPATHRSAHPNIPGVPWWGAVVIAMTAIVIGFAFDAGSGNKELTSVFAALYFVGCVAAVLAVRQNGVFTAVVQPPVLLFIAVPGAYFLFHQSEINGLKDILINCGYPLIERFLLMFTTSVVVLLIGAARWYFGKAAPAADQATDAEPAAPTAGARAKLSSLFGGGNDAEDDEDDSEPPRAQGVDRPGTAQRRSSSRRPSSGSPKRPPPTRSRHARPPIDDLDEPSAPPRRRRPPANESEPRRRPRAPREPREPGARKPAREYRERDRESWDRETRDPIERPRRRPNPYESYDPSETLDAPPRPRRPTAGTGSGSGSTHHPVSRVRYRGSDDGDDRVEYRTRPRHSLDSDHWPE